MPLELVKYDGVSGKFLAGAEALAVLRRTRGPVGVVAVCGRARQGKSYILNQLLQQTSGHGFTVGPTVRPCTKGLWMWSAPQRRIAPDGSETHLVRVTREDGLIACGIAARKFKGRRAAPAARLGHRHRLLTLPLQVLLDTEGIDAYDQVDWRGLLCSWCRAQRGKRFALMHVALHTYADGAIQHTNFLAGGAAVLPVCVQPHGWHRRVGARPSVARHRNDQAHPRESRPG